MRAHLSTVVAAAATLFALAAPAQDLGVRIGHVAPMSGPFAWLGRDVENGARLAIDEFNAQGIAIGGRTARLELVTQDDKGDPAQAVAAARILVDAKVSGIEGHMFSSTSIAASKVYCAAGIPQVSPATTSPRFTRAGCKTAFRVLADDTQISGALARYAVRELNAVRIATIDDGSDYGRSSVEAFSVAATAAGARTVESQHVDDKAVDFTAVLTAIRSKTPDVVFFGGYAPQAAMMIGQMKQLDIRARFMGGDGICTPDIPQRAGDAIGEIQVVCGLPGDARRESSAMERFRADFRKKFDGDPLTYAPYAYDAVGIIVDAMVRAGSSDPARYLPALAATNGYKGLTGTISFDEKGDIRNGAVSLFTFKGWKMEVVGVVH
jgi:branched-chain amino acid transport system substrate-binding protein